MRPTRKHQESKRFAQVLTNQLSLLLYPLTEIPIIISCMQGLLLPWSCCFRLLPLSEPLLIFLLTSEAWKSLHFIYWVYLLPEPVQVPYTFYEVFVNHFNHSKFSILSNLDGILEYSNTVLLSLISLCYSLTFPVSYPTRMVICMKGWSSFVFLQGFEQWQRHGYLTNTCWWMDWGIITWLVNVRGYREKTCPWDKQSPCLVSKGSRHSNHIILRRIVGRPPCFTSTIHHSHVTFKLTAPLN